MPHVIYNPFDPLTFSKQICFLSGHKLTTTHPPIHVFPSWLLEHYVLQDKPFKLLDDSITTYSELKIPCAASVNQKITDLEKEIACAFISGYEAVKRLPSIRIFQWVGKLIYGILFNEISIGIRQQTTVGQPFTLSQSLIHKFRNLHSMLQSIIQPIQFEDNLPWSIQVVPIQSTTDTFSYRDEINTLTFSLKMRDFGIIACLQDNGTNKVYHQNLLTKMVGQALDPIQFEELCGRFFYSNYLFNRLPDYMILPTDDAIYIEAMSLKGTSNKPLFDSWQNKIYGQVLESFWKPWHIPLSDVLKNPEMPLSFLLEDTGEIKAFQNIKYPPS